MKVAIVGSRNCNNLAVERILRHIPENCSGVVSGGAMGVDSLAEEAARIRKLPFEKILPDYENYGREAPILRNIEIVKKADLVLAFWDYRSRGTAHTIAQCVERHVPVRIIDI